MKLFQFHKSFICFRKEADGDMNFSIGMEAMEDSLPDVNGGTASDPETIQEFVERIEKNPEIIFNNILLNAEFNDQNKNN